MPAKSSKQYKFMQAVKHGSSNNPMAPSKEVASHFIEKTPKKKRALFAKKKR